MLSTILVTLAVVPTIVHLFLEAHVTFLVHERIRLYNAVDLVGMSVFYHVIFQGLQYEVLEKHKPTGETTGSRRERMQRTISLTSSALYTVFQVARLCSPPA